jgi:hypothetical protein
MGRFVANLVLRRQGSTTSEEGVDALERTLTWKYWADRDSAAKSPFVVTRAGADPDVGPDAGPRWLPTPSVYDTFTLELNLTLRGVDACSTLDEKLWPSVIAHYLEHLQTRNPLQFRFWQIPHQAGEFYHENSALGLQTCVESCADWHGEMRISIDTTVSLPPPAAESADALSPAPPRRPETGEKGSEEADFFWDMLDTEAPDQQLAAMWGPHPMKGN